MRITNSMISNNVMYNLNNSLYSLNKTYSQMSSGKSIETPSDNPVGASTVLKYSAYMSKIEQYQQNSEDATSWLKVTEGALGGITDALTTVRERMVQAFNGTLTDEDRADILAEVQELTEEVVELCNTDYAGRYVFGGFQTEESPVAADSSSAIDMITYQGKYTDLGGAVSTDVSDADLLAFYTANTGNVVDTTVSQSKTYNTGFNSTVTVNTEGWEVLGTGADGMYETLKKFQMYLEGDTEYKYVDDTGTVVTETLDTDALLDSMDANQDTILNLTARAGARRSALELSTQRLTDDYEIYDTLLSETQDVDIAKISVEYSEAESVYEASLKASSKLVLPSLVDFLL